MAGAVSATDGGWLGPVQATPFTAKSVGGRFAEPLLPLKPTCAVPPPGSVGDQAGLVTLTTAPLWLKVPFQPCVTRCPSGNVQVRFQPFSASPSLRIDTLAPNPVFHSLVIS